MWRLCRRGCARTLVAGNRAPLQKSTDVVRTLPLAHGSVTYWRVPDSGTSPAAPSTGGDVRNLAVSLRWLRCPATQQATHGVHLRRGHTARGLRPTTGLGAMFTNCFGTWIVHLATVAITLAMRCGATVPGQGATHQQTTNLVIGTTVYLPTAYVLCMRVRYCIVVPSASMLWQGLSVVRTRMADLASDAVSSTPAAGRILCQHRTDGVGAGAGRRTDNSSASSRHGSRILPRCLDADMTAVLITAAARSSEQPCHMIIPTWRPAPSSLHVNERQILCRWAGTAPAVSALRAWWIRACATSCIQRVKRWMGLPSGRLHRTD